MCVTNIAEVPTSTSITHYKEKENTILQLLSSSLFVVGHILDGEKEILVGESSIKFHKGETYFLSIGRHYAKNLTSKNTGIYEELMITMCSSDVQKYVEQITKNVTSSNDNPCCTCDFCTAKRFIPVPEVMSLPLFFTLMMQFMGDKRIIRNESILTLVVPALLYILFTAPNKCIKGKILAARETDEDKFKNYICEHVFKDMTIEDLATEAGCSVSLFNKKFKSLFGSNPHDWIMHERLKYGKFLLRTTAYPIEEISKLCCIPNFSHFSRRFKKQYNMSPLQYRELHSNY